MEKINLREERDFGQKINCTFLFLQQNFRPLFRNLLYYAGPFSLLGGIFIGLYQSNQLNPGMNDPSGLNSLDAALRNIFNFNYVAGMLLAFLARLIVIGVTFAFMAEYLRKEETEIRNISVWDRLGGNFLPLLLTALFYFAVLFLVALVCSILAMYVGFGGIPTNMDAVLPRAFLIPVLGLLVMIPVIYLAVKLCLFPAVIFMEEKWGIAAFSRSWNLVTGKWWSTFGLVIVMTIIVAIIGLAFQIPMLLISVFGVLLQINEGGSSQLIIVLAAVIGILGETLLYSIVNLALGFQYFNLVERQESIGLMHEIDSLGRRPDSRPNEGEY